MDQPPDHFRKIKVMPEKRNVPAKKMGRPTLYNEQLAAEICTRIVKGESLRNICRDADMPNIDTIYVWLGKHPIFAEQYTRAREEQADTLADEIQALSDEPPPMVPGKYGEVVDTGWLQWQRQRIDARKWVAAKLKPKKYGDRVQVAGDAENPLKTETTIQASELFTSILQNMELKKQQASNE